MVRSLLVVCACVAAGGVVSLGACGGSETTVGDSPDSGSSTDEAGGGDGSSSTESGGGAYTLDNVCDLIAPRICALRKPCCEKTSGYDEAGCIAKAKDSCAKDVAAVKAGQETFDGTRVDECLTKLAPLFDTCFLQISDIPRAAQLLNQCHVFTGSVGEGLPCQRDNECKPASGDAFVSCTKDENVCHTILILGQGANCELRDRMNAICGEGLYCDVPLATLKGGTCKPALALGATCKHTEPLACGLGNYCNSSEMCEKGRPGGAACDGNLQCASIKCRGDKVDGGADSGADAGGTDGPGKCLPLDPIVKPGECGK